MYLPSSDDASGFCFDSYLLFIIDLNLIVFSIIYCRGSETIKAALLFKHLFEKRSWNVSNE